MRLRYELKEITKLTPSPFNEKEIYNFQFILLMAMFE